MSAGVVRWRITTRPQIDFYYSGGAAQGQNFNDLSVVEAVNRYASHFEVRFDDDSGVSEENWPKGQRADLEYSTDGGSTYSQKLAGFVQRTERDGRNGDLIVLFVGYDHFLRREPIYTTYTNELVSDVIQDLIVNHTPIYYSSFWVDVQNDVQVTREVNGERVDEVLSWLAQQSGGANYGVINTFRFFWQPPGTSSAPGNLDMTDITDYNIPQESRQEVNAVRVFYGDGDTVPKSSVIDEDRAAQLDLKEKLDANRRVVIQKDVNYPEITDRDAALSKARELRSRSQSILTGDVSTFGKYDWSAGDVFRLTIPEKNIDGQFIVHEIHHDMLGSTLIKVASDVANVEDMLIEMSDDITRVDIRDADPDATYTRSVEVGVGATVAATGEVTRTSPSGSSTVEASVTLDGLTKFRDAWQGESVDAVNTVKVGTGDRPPTTADADLESVLGTVTFDAATEVSTNGIEFTGTIPSGSLAGQTISEFGFYDASGNLQARAVLDTPLLHESGSTTSLSLTLSLANDTSRVGDMTSVGLERARDLYLGAVAATYAPTLRQYGDPSTGVLVQDADIAGEWKFILDDYEHANLYANDRFEAEQHVWFGEAEDGPRSGGAYYTGAEPHASGYEARYIYRNDTGEAGAYITTDRFIAAGDVGIAWRIRPDTAYEFSLDPPYPEMGQAQVQLNGANVSGFSSGWSTSIGEYRYMWDETYAYSLSAGTHVVSYEQQDTAGDTDVLLDAFAIYDASTMPGDPGDWDNVVDSDNWLSSPEFYEPPTTREALVVEPGDYISKIVVNTTQADTSEDQAIGVRAGDDATAASWNTYPNTNTVTRFVDDVKQAQVRFTVGGYGTRNTATPTNDYLPQYVDTYELLVDLQRQAPIETTVDEGAGQTSGTIEIGLNDSVGTDIDAFADKNDHGETLSQATIETISKTADFAVLVRILTTFSAA